MRPAEVFSWGLQLLSLCFNILNTFLFDQTLLCYANSYLAPSLLSWRAPGRSGQWDNANGEQEEERGFAGPPHPLGRSLPPLLLSLFLLCRGCCWSEGLCHGRTDAVEGREERIRKLKKDNRMYSVLWHNAMKSNPSGQFRSLCHMDMASDVIAVCIGSCRWQQITVVFLCHVCAEKMPKLHHPLLSKLTFALTLNIASIGYFNV